MSGIEDSVLTGGGLRMGFGATFVGTRFCGTCGRGGGERSGRTGGITREGCDGAAETGESKGGSIMGSTFRLVMRPSATGS